MLAFAHLLAEAEAFPLHAEAATATQLTILSRPSTWSLEEKTTKPLAEALEEHLRLRASGRSIASLEGLRDAAWFRRGQNEDHNGWSLAEYACNLACEYVTVCNGRVRVRSEGIPPEIAERVLRLRWLTLALPTDLLVASVLATMSPPVPLKSDRIDLADDALRKVLRRGVVDTHVHIGAGFAFGSLWSVIMMAHNNEGILSTTFEEANGDLLTAAIVRIVLAEFLRRGRGLGVFTEVIDEWLTRVQKTSTWVSQAGTQKFTSTVHAALERFKEGRSPNEGERSQLRDAFRSLYRHVIPEARCSGAGCFENLKNLDPAILNDGDFPEIDFAASALRRLREVKVSSPVITGDFSVLFFQYQRVRNRLYRSLVAKPGISGLDWFTRSYQRMLQIGKSLDPHGDEAAIANASSDVHLLAYEARATPSRKSVKILDDVARLCALGRSGTQQSYRPEVVCVLHFVKPGRTNKGDPSRPTLMRHGRWYKEAAEQARAIAAAFDESPEILLQLRGIDVASAELSIPTWAIAPLFEIVREAAGQAAAKLLARGRPLPSGVRPIRATVHAGEEFRAPLEGLRRVHELLEFGLLEEGDRIGHGLSLGMDWERWSSHNRTIIQPRQERLDDLLWEMDRYDIDGIGAAATRVRKIQSEAVRLAEQIYNSTISLDDLSRMRRLLGRPETLYAWGYPTEKPGKRPRDELDRLIRLHLIDASVADRGRGPEIFTLDPCEVAVATLLQLWMRCQVAAKRITIEACPSSNLVILNSERIRDLPMFRLLSPDRVSSRLKVSINSDDPINFATSLADEYAYAYHALVGDGRSTKEALHWVNLARRCGLASRFGIR